VLQRCIERDHIQRGIRRHVASEARLGLVHVDLVVGRGTDSGFYMPPIGSESVEIGSMDE
jgi:hypothetical protein